MKTLRQTIKLNGIMTGVLMALALSGGSYGQVLERRESKLYSEAVELKMGVNKGTKNKRGGAPAAPVPDPAQAPAQAPAQPQPFVNPQDQQHFSYTAPDTETHSGQFTIPPKRVIPEKDVDTIFDDELMDDVEHRFHTGRAATRDGIYLGKISHAFVHLLNHLPSVGAVEREETDLRSGVTLPRVNDAWFQNYGAMVVGNISDTSSEGSVTLMMKFNMRVLDLRNNLHSGICGVAEAKPSSFSGFTVSISQTGGDAGNWAVNGHPLFAEDAGNDIYDKCLDAYGTVFANQGKSRDFGTHTYELIEAILLLARSHDGTVKSASNRGMRSWVYTLELLGRNNYNLHRYLGVSGRSGRLAQELSIDQFRFNLY